MTENLAPFAILAALAAGYLCGSIPFGLIITRLAGKGDIRQVGSGNIGATNVLRTGSKPLAAATLLGDLLKGTLGVVIGGIIAAQLSGAAPGAGSGAYWGALAGGLGAFLGHLYPVWLGFRGGKGVATYIGVLLGLDWRIAAAFCLVWLLVAVIARLSSLSALVAAAIAPLAALALAPRSVAAMIAVLSILVFFRHTANIQRLMAGTEPRIGQKG